MDAHVGMRAGGTRGRLVLLLGLTALLVTARAPATRSVHEASPGVAPVASSSAMAPDAVERLLTTVNPALSPAHAERIARSVLRYSRKYGLDPSLVTAVLLVESGARPGARSPKGALGLMQVMPHMMRPLGMAGSPSTVESNVEAGCIILAGNIERLGEADGISAYFWGSDIRGASYLNRVRAARERVRAESRS